MLALMFKISEFCFSVDHAIAVTVPDCLRDIPPPPLSHSRRSLAGQLHLSRGQGDQRDGLVGAGEPHGLRPFDSG